MGSGMLLSPSEVQLRITAGSSGSKELSSCILTRMLLCLCIFGSLSINLGCRAHSSISACGLVFPGAEAADHEGVGIDDAGRFSHADELFNYKGQLLPLHFRARLQMLEKLLYDINQQEEAEIMTSSSTILLLLLLVFILLVFSKLQGRQSLNP
ncbi:unnamed protein product [Sphagnum tenellum]